MTKARQRKKASSSLVKQAGCDGKVQLSMTLARKIAKTKDKKMSAYRCRFCGWWHVGENSGKVLDKKKRLKMEGDSENQIARARARG